MTRLRIEALFGVAATLASIACGGQVRWGAETAAVETTQQDPIATPATPKKLTAKEFAATFPSGRDCAREAQRQYATDQTRGWTLMVSCVGRGDYTDLPALVEGPWREQLQTTESGHDVLLTVVAARGGEVAVDVVASQERRFPLLTLEEAFEDPVVAAGKLVLLRGVAKKKPKRQPSGKLALDVHELVFDVEAIGRGAFESGRVLQLQVEELEDAPKVGKPHVLLVRFAGVVEEADLPLEAIDGEPDPAAGLSPAAQSLRGTGALLASQVPAPRR